MVDLLFDENYRWPKKTSYLEPRLPSVRKKTQDDITEEKMAMMIDNVHKEKQNTYIARIAAFHCFD